MTTEKPKLNLYQKVQIVRKRLLDMSLKMTGHNTYSGYKYYELSDFLPQLVHLMDEFGLLTMFSIIKECIPGTVEVCEYAVLEVADSEAPEVPPIVFKLPTVEAMVGKKRDGSGGATAIQNQGAKQTFMRRYVLMAAFEIVESDFVEKQKAKEPAQLDVEVVERLNQAKDLDDLAAIAKDLKDEVDPKLVAALREEYTAVKNRLEGKDEDN